MAEVLAAGTRLAGIFASGCARVVAPGAALQRACGSDSADATVSANSRGQAGTLRSAACFAAVCGIAAGVGAASHAAPTPAAIPHTAAKQAADRSVPAWPREFAETVASAESLPQVRCSAAPGATTRAQPEANIPASRVPAARTSAIACRLVVSGQTRLGPILPNSSNRVAGFA